MSANTDRIDDFLDSLDDSDATELFNRARDRFNFHGAIITEPDFSELVLSHIETDILDTDVQDKLGDNYAGIAEEIAGHDAFIDAVSTKMLEEGYDFVVDLIADIMSQFKTGKIQLDLSTSDHRVMKIEGFADLSEAFEMISVLHEVTVGHIVDDIENGNGLRFRQSWTIDRPEATITDAVFVVQYGLSDHGYFEFPFPVRNPSEDTDK